MAYVYVRAGRGTNMTVAVLEARFFYSVPVCVFSSFLCAFRCFPSGMLQQMIEFARRHLLIKEESTKRKAASCHRAV